MNRRTQLKLESAKLYVRKNILSGRFIVKHTFAIMLAAGAVGTVALGASLIDTNSKDDKAVVAEADQDYSISISEMPMLADSSVDKLYTVFEDGEALTAANENWYR